MSSQGLKRRIMVSLLSAIAFVVMYVEFPIPFFPPFLMIDFSDLPAFVGALAFGPVYGVVIELVKNLLHYIIKGSMSGVPIGELSNFMAGSTFIFITTWIYHRSKTKASLITGLMVGTAGMSIVMAVANYFFLMPAYVWFLGYKIEDIIAMANQVNHQITDLFTLVVLAIAPFNVVKGIILGIILLPFYKRIKAQLQ